MANYGLRVWDAAGQLSLDISDSITRKLGEFDTGTSDGSVAIPELANGRPYFNLNDTVSPSAIETTCPPRVVISTAGITWTFDSGVGGAYRRSVRVIYGLY